MVDFPQPVHPINPTISPGFISKLMLYRLIWLDKGYWNVTSLKVILPLISSLVKYDTPFLVSSSVGNKKTLEEAKICFEKADDDAQGTPFAFQLIQNSDFDTQDSYKIASKVNGLVYKQNVDNRRMIYYRHSKYKELKKTGNEENNIINFNLKIIEGDPKFYIHHCEMFPNCEYNNDTIAKYKQDGSLITPTKVGDFFIGSIDTADEKHELSGDQYLVIVDCSTSPIDCLFEISFYDERDKLKLRPSDSFNQFMTKEDNDQFTFTILDPNVKQVDVKLHVLSGNAYIEKTEQPKEVKAPTTIDVGSNQIKRYTAEGGKLTGDYTPNNMSNIKSFLEITMGNKKTPLI